MIRRIPVIAFAATITSVFTLHGVGAQGTPLQVAVAPTVTLPDSGHSFVDEGVSRLQQYERTFDKTDAYIARQLLERAVEREPNNARAHFALGMALARGPDLRERPYYDAAIYRSKRFSLAAQHAPKELRRALQLDPALDSAALELAQFALDLVDRKLMREALKLLENRQARATPEMNMIRGRLLSRLDEAFEASGAFELAKKGGADASVASHDKAIALFKISGRERQASDDYFAGIDALTDTGAGLYYADLLWILSDEQVAKWKNLSLDGRKEFLRKYWETSAALSGVPVASRVAAHFNRLTPIVERPDAPVITGGALNAHAHNFWKGSLLDLSLPLATTIRHGDPTRAMRALYCEPGWDTIPQPLQPTAVECMRSPYGRAVMSRMSVAPQVAKQMSREAAQYAAKGSGFYPPWKTHLAVAWQALQFRAAGGGALVVGAVGVRGESAAHLINRDNELDASIMISLVDTLDGWVRQETRRKRWPQVRITDDSWLLMGVSTPAPSANDVALRLTVQSADGNAGRIASGTINVSSFDPDSLTMSDVVLSPADGAGAFERGNVRIALAPGRSFQSSEQPTLYYEVYGVRAGTTLRSEVRVVPVRESILDRMRARLGRDDGAVAFQFQETAGEPDPVVGLQQSRSIGISDLIPGVYKLIVTVTEADTGRTTRRETIMQVDGPPAPIQH